MYEWTAQQRTAATTNDNRGHWMVIATLDKCTTTKLSTYAQRIPQESSNLEQQMKGLDYARYSLYYKFLLKAKL